MARYQKIIINGEDAGVIRADKHPCEEQHEIVSGLPVDKPRFVRVIEFVTARPRRRKQLVYEEDSEE